MSQFSLSDSINKEKVFLLDSSKIEKRLDVEMYLLVLAVVLIFIEILYIKC